jgi:23S rRNA (adenine2503-C2)-methyltransferase
MKVIKKIGKEELATVYIAENNSGKRIEFVESVQPPYPREDKWVLMLSTLFGCPIECEMCDAGGSYSGKLTKEELIAQIDYIVSRRYPDFKIPSKKFKIQFARVGEPAFNNNVLEVLNELPNRYDAPGLFPSISTIAPRGREDFFNNLLEIKKKLYPKNFQLQFSLHTTNEALRDRIIPTPKWSFKKIAQHGEKFFDKDGRKITLNFALAEEYEIDPTKIAQLFSPEFFFIKITPINPTYKAQAEGLKTAITTTRLDKYDFVNPLRSFGFDVLVSIGELEENLIGSNCGQYIKAYEENSNLGKDLKESYTIADLEGMQRL